MKLRAVKLGDEVCIYLDYSIPGSPTFSLTPTSIYEKYKVVGFNFASPTQRYLLLGTNINSPILKTMSNVKVSTTGHHYSGDVDQFLYGIWVQDDWPELYSIIDPATGSSIVFSTMPDLELDLPQKNEKQSTNTGVFCKGCRMWNEYAVANQKDQTYLCYNCRN